jgi:hypothetical protein
MLGVPGQSSGTILPMPNGLVLALDVEDGQRFAFVYDGRGWAAATFVLAILLAALARTDAVANEPIALWFFAAMAFLMLVGCIRNLGSHLTVHVDRASGLLTCSGKWSWRSVSWTKKAHEFKELRVVRGSVDGGPAMNLYLELVGRDGVPVLLRSRGFFESTRHPLMLGLAKRLADVLQVPLSDHS